MTLPPGRPERAAFAFIFATALLDMLGFGIAIPILPRLSSPDIVLIRTRGDEGSLARLAKQCAEAGWDLNLPAARQERLRVTPTLHRRTRARPVALLRGRENVSLLDLELDLINEPGPPQITETSQSAGHQLLLVWGAAQEQLLSPL